VFDRLFSFIGRTSWRRPFLSLGAAAIVCAVCALLATRITFRGDLTYMLPRDCPSVRSLRSAMQALGLPGHLYLLIEADRPGSSEPLAAYADALAGELGRLKGVKNVDYRTDSRFGESIAKIMERDAILLLPPEKLPEFLALTERASMERSVSGLRRKLAGTGISASDFEAKHDVLGLRRFLLREVFARKSSYDMDLSTGYLISKDHSALLMIIETEKSGDDLVFSRNLMADVEKAEAEARRKVSTEGRRDISGLSVLRCGSPAIAAESEREMKRDLQATILSSLVMVTLLYIFGFGRLRSVVPMTISLAIGICWSFGFVALAFGHLTAVTVAFAAMLVGLAIDFPIHIYNRFLCEHGREGTGENAIGAALGALGRPLLTAAVTTAGGLFCLALTGLPPLTELGFLAGIGIMISLVSVVVTLPALLALEHRWMPRSGRGVNLLQKGLTAFVRTTTTWRAGIVGGFAALVIGAVLAAVFCGSPGFDFEPRADNIRSDSETMMAEREIVRKFRGTLDRMMIVCDGRTMQEALSACHDLHPAMEELMERGVISGYESAADIIPPEKVQARVIAGIKDFDGLQFQSDFGEVLEGNGFAADAFKDYSSWVRGLLAVHTPLLPGKGRASDIDAIAVNYMGRADGRGVAALFLTPKEATWDKEDRDRVIAEIKDRIDKQGGSCTLTGISVMMAEIEQISRRGLVASTAAAMAFVVLLVFIHFRKLSHSALALMPVMTGMVLVAGTMKLLGMKLNFFNLMVFPVIIGIGIDSGVHIVHRYVSDARLSLAGLMEETGLAVFLTSATTVAGFGSLALAKNPALRSTGTIACIGIGWCLLGSLVALPAFLKLLEGRVDRAAASAPRADEGFVYPFIMPVYWFSIFVPRHVGLPIARVVGSLVSHLMPGGTSAAASNARLAVPGVSGRDARRIARETFRNYGVFLLDCMYLRHAHGRRRRDFIKETAGEENLAKARGRKTGVIIASPHFGHWEMGGVLLGSAGIPLHIVSWERLDGATMSFLEGLRSRSGIRTHYVGKFPPSPGEAFEAGLDVLRALHGGECVAMLVDRHTPGRAVRVSFPRGKP
jgi:predicted RND superfamily exporter protein/lauroyl/myristoyl acyltransferase